MRRARRGTIPLAALLGAVLLLLLGALPVAAPPPAPMRVQGSAYDAAGSAFGPGTPIRAFVDGVEYSDGPDVQNALGDFVVLVEGNAVSPSGGSETPEILEGPNLGDDVLFAAGDFTGPTPVFQEVLPWQTAAIVTQDLHGGSAGTNPAPLKIQGLVTQPARGGNQVLRVCNPAAASVPLSDYYIELDRPGTFHGPSRALSGSVPAGGWVDTDLGSPSFLTVTGDAVKLVFRNPGGANAAAQGQDIPVDRVEFNATQGGTLFWEPGNTILGDAPAPGPGRILERISLCGDTNSPSDFRLAVEPGLPPNGPPSADLLAPLPGSVVPSGQAYEVSWTMSDDLFNASLLQVWVNVSYAGTTQSLLDGAQGASSVVWAVPALDVPDALLTLDIVDPLGARTRVSASFAIRAPDPFAGLGPILAGIVLAVLAAAILWGYFYAARKAEAPAKPPPAPPPSREPPPPARPAQEPATPPAGKKLCPRCGTAVNERDWVCFFCGFRFPGPPP